MSEKKKEYETWVKCDNCEKTYQLKIPMGIPKDKYLEKALCTKCGVPIEHPEEE